MKDKGFFIDNVSADVVDKIRPILDDSENFNDLTALAGFDPKKDFRYADLSYVDFSGSDLRNHDFTGADLRGAVGVGVRWDDSTTIDDADSRESAPIICQNGLASAPRSISAWWALPEDAI
jgi:uncharacterized protein YjbI with pentapeptide repeats